MPTSTIDHRAMELLAGRLDDCLPIEDIAQACGLSRGQFSKAFKRTTGMSPHAWRMSHRLDRARVMLRDDSIPLADIALACGFSDQPHFTRAFRQSTGRSPGAWRRESDR